MKPEPLDLEEIEKNAIKELNVRESGIALKTIQFAKQRIKSACEFYLRYWIRPDLLAKEHPEYKKELRKQIGISLSLVEGENVYLLNYQEWLFRLAFKDVLEMV